MPSIKDLRKRIVTVSNTRQTTKAMKMVSAAKLRRAQEAIMSQRPFAKKIGSMIQTVAAAGLGSIEVSPLIGETTGQGRTLLVIVTSDRGLCGGFNSNIIKAAQRWVDEEKSKRASIEICCVGKRGYEFFKTKPNYKSRYFGEFGGKVQFTAAKKLSAHLVDEFASKKVDEVVVIYNEFKNAISQRVIVEQYLPLNPNAAQAGTTTANPELFIMRPAQPALLDALLRKHFGVQAFRILLESQASEHGARMSAMENATKNAGEMIRKLTLLYNKQRQAGITKELLEIISGSESQKV